MKGKEKWKKHMLSSRLRLWVEQIIIHRLSPPLVTLLSTQSIAEHSLTRKSYLSLKWKRCLLFKPPKVRKELWGKLRAVSSHMAVVYSGPIEHPWQSIPPSRLGTQRAPPRQMALEPSTSHVPLVRIVSQSVPGDKIVSWLFRGLPGVQCKTN